MPHAHISGLEAVITALYVLVIFGTLNLVAMKYKDTSNLAKTYAHIFGL